MGGEVNPEQVVALLVVIANLQLQITERDQRLSQLEDTLAKLTHPESA